MQERIRGLGTNLIEYEVSGRIYLKAAMFFMKFQTIDLSEQSKSQRKFLMHV